MTRRGQQASPQQVEQLRQQIITAIEFQDNKQAITLLTRAMKLAPKEPSLPYNRGLIYVRLAQFKDALADFERTLKLNPDDALALNERGICLCRLGKVEAGIASFERSLRLKPNDADSWSNLGLGLHTLKQYDKALVSFDCALALVPHHMDAMHGRGVVLSALKHYPQALEALDGVLRLNPQHTEALNNRGAVLVGLKRYDEAMAHYNQAIAFVPNFASAYRNRGLLHLDQLQLEQAVEDLARAHALDGQDARNILDEGLISLLRGDFAHGWPLYESRRQVESYPALRGKYWLGDTSLSGKTILLYCEQGLGDTLQFCRYVPLIKALAARVILVVQPSLIELLRPLDVDFLASTDDLLPSFDVYCYLMSLPLALQTSLETIPSSPTCIAADAKKVAVWKAQLGRSEVPRIGLCWSGSADHKRDQDRSIALAQLVAILPPGPNYIALQKELRDADRVTLEDNPHIYYVGEQLQDFTDTASLVASMDLVISVDTSVAHLAGVMGKNLWLLISFVPDFRWLLHRHDSPWYPNAKLYRQPYLKDWSTVLTHMGQNLEQWLREKKDA